MASRSLPRKPLARTPLGEVVCGVDEAGRGPLAGAVFAAAVILDPGKRVRGIRDSKLLTASERERLALQIQERSTAWAVAHASVEEIDALNILGATLLAMQRAVDALRVPAQHAWIDGPHCPALSIPSRPIINGDATVLAIAAASILAKTARDAYMLELHALYPEYGFDQHMGYGTPRHLAELDRHGATPVHRASFAPVRAVLSRARS